MKVYVLNNNQELREYSLTISEVINERSNATFQLKTDLSVTFEKGNYVEIHHEDNIIYRGYISSVTHKDYYARNVRLHQIDTVDNHYLVDKRVYIKGHIDTSAGDIVKHMINTVLREEGIAWEEGSIEDGIVFPALSFNYKNCNEVMDYLCELCGFIWYVDINKILHFKNPQAQDTSTVITDADILKDTLVITNKNNQYRNKQYLKGGTGETNTITQIFKGDGTTKSFVLGYKLSQKPRIWVKKGNADWRYVREDDIVEKSYSKETAEFYYEKKDAVILQNPDHEAYTSGDLIKVEYVGMFPIIAIAEKFFEVGRSAKVIGEDIKTNLVENVANEAEINTIYEAVLSCHGKLNKYGADTFSVEFTSLKRLAKVGELIAFDTYELKDDLYLVTKVEITDDVNTVFYKYTCSKGALCDTWTKLMANGLKKQVTVANQDLAEQETVVYARTFEKIWLENDHPNIYKELYPSKETFPVNIYPMFKPNERVLYCEVIGEGGKVLSRNRYSVQSKISDERLISYFYFDIFQAEGKWIKLRFKSGDSATWEIGTGITIDEVPLELEKNALEGVQIMRIDVKGF